MNIKHAILSVVAFISWAVAGCALSYHRSNDTDGFDFPGGNVSKIIKKKTTGEEIIQMFGGPLSKSAVAENEELWRYSYTTRFVVKESGFLTDEVESRVQRKTLDIRLKNGTVTDFTYTESH